MTAKSIRSFAGGIIVAAGVCGAVYFFGSDGTTNSQTVEQPSVAEMKSLLTSKGYIIHTEEEWNKQLDTINKTKVDNSKEVIKEAPKDQIVYRSILTVSKGMTSIDVGKALQRAKIIKKGSEFSKEVEKRKLESDLRPGTYQVESGMTMDEIIKAIFK